MPQTFYKGVPLGNLQKANRLTVPGSLIDVKRYEYSRGLTESNALNAVADSLQRRILPAHLNPYHKALATDVYSVQLGGLGDAAQPLPASVGGGTNPGQTGWFGVLNTVAGNLSQSIGCKISGACNPARAAFPMTSPPSLPLFPIAMLGGGALLLMALLRGRGKRARA